MYQRFSKASPILEQDQAAERPGSQPNEGASSQNAQNLPIRIKKQLDDLRVVSTPHSGHSNEKPKSQLEMPDEQNPREDDIQRRLPSKEGGSEDATPGQSSTKSNAPAAFKMKPFRNSFEKKEQQFVSLLVFELSKQMEVIKYILLQNQGLEWEKAASRVVQVLHNHPYKEQQLCLLKNKNRVISALGPQQEWFHVSTKFECEQVGSLFMHKESVSEIYSCLNAFAMKYLLANRMLNTAQEMVKIATLLCRHFPMLFTAHPDLLHPLQQNICLLKLKGLHLNTESTLTHLLGLQENKDSDRTKLTSAISFNNQAVLFLARADFQEAARCSAMSINCIEPRVFSMLDQLQIDLPIFSKMLQALLISYLNLSESTLDHSSHQFNRQILLKGMQLSFQHLGDQSMFFKRFHQKYSRLVYFVFRNPNEQQVATESEEFEIKSPYSSMLERNPYECYQQILDQSNKGFSFSYPDAVHPIDAHKNREISTSQTNQYEISSPSKIQDFVPASRNFDSERTNQVKSFQQNPAANFEIEALQEQQRRSVAVGVVKPDQNHLLLRQEEINEPEQPPASQTQHVPTVNQTISTHNQKSLTSEQYEFIEQKLEQERVKMRQEVLRKLQETKMKFERQMMEFQMQMMQQQMQMQMQMIQPHNSIIQPPQISSGRQHQPPNLQTPSHQVSIDHNQSRHGQTNYLAHQSGDSIQQQGENVQEPELNLNPVDLNANQRIPEPESQRKKDSSRDQQSSSRLSGRNKIQIDKLSERSSRGRQQKQITIVQIEKQLSDNPKKKLLKLGQTEAIEPRKDSLIPKEINQQIAGKRRASYSFAFGNPLITIKSSNNRTPNQAEPAATAVKQSRVTLMNRRNTISQNTNIHETVKRKMSKKLEESQFQDVWITSGSRMFLRNKSLANRKNSQQVIRVKNPDIKNIHGDGNSLDDEMSINEDEIMQQQAKRLSGLLATESKLIELADLKSNVSKEGQKRNTFKLIKTQDTQLSSAKSKAGQMCLISQRSKYVQRLPQVNPFDQIKSEANTLYDLKKMVETFESITDDALKQQYYEETFESPEQQLESPTVVKNMFMLRSLLHNYQFVQLFSPYKLWAIKTNIIHEICQSKEPILSYHLIQVVASKKKKALRNIKVVIMAEYLKEKAKYEPKRLEKSMDREYLQNLGYSIKITIYAELDKKQTKDKSGSNSLFITQKIELNLVELQTIMCMFQNTHKINTSFESSLPFASIDTFDHLCKNALFKYINLKKIKQTDPNVCPYIIDFQSQPRSKSYHPCFINFLANKPKQEKCRVELFHLKDVNWRLMICLPMEDAMRVLKTNSKENGLDLDQMANQPQDINCYHIDIHCASIEVAKKMFIKLHTKQFEFPTQHKQQNTRQAWAIISDFEALYKQHFQKFVLTLEHLLKEEYPEVFEETEIPYQAFVTLLQSRRLVNTQITINEQFNSVFRMEMTVILRKPGQEKDLKFIMFYSNNNTHGQVKRCDIPHETSVQHLCSLFAQSFATHSLESFFILRQTCRQYIKTLQLTEIEENVSESDQSLLSDSMGSASFDSDDSSSGQGSNSTKKKAKEPPKKLMKVEQLPITTMMQRRSILKVPRSKQDYAVVTCELIVCEKLSLIMGLKLQLFDPMKQEQQGVYLNINQNKWPKIKQIPNERNQFYNKWSIVQLLRSFGLQYLLNNCIFLKIPLDKPMANKYVMFIQTKENLLLQTEFGSQNRHLCEDQFVQHTIKPLEYYLTMHQLLA